jgi:hypothetical protein
MTMRRMVLMLVALGAVGKVGMLAWRGSVDAVGTAVAAVGDGWSSGGPCTEDERGFRELVEDVRARSAELERRDAEVRAREASLAAVRAVVASEVARLEAVAKTLGITGGPGVSITRVYESMSAQDAAPILDRLDDGTLRAVLRHMRERQVAAILAAMTRERAVAVTKAFAIPGGQVSPSLAGAPGR